MGVLRRAPYGCAPQDPMNNDSPRREAALILLTCFGSGVFLFRCGLNRSLTFKEAVGGPGLQKGSAFGHQRWHRGSEKAGGTKRIIVQGRRCSCSHYGSLVLFAAFQTVSPENYAETSENLRPHRANEMFGRVASCRADRFTDRSCRPQGSPRSYELR
jgi:hypothetical protein